jgi:hypothetical protein
MTHSSMARPIDNSIIEEAVAQVEVPDTVQYIDCDPKDPYCGECLSAHELLRFMANPCSLRQSNRRSLY